MKNKLSKIAAVLLILALVFSTLAVSGSTAVAAAAKKKTDSKPARPAITLKAGKEMNRVTVTVRKTKNAAGYYIFLSEDGGENYWKIKTLKKDGTAKRKYVIKGLKPGNTYTIKVQAYNKNGKKTVKGSYSKAKSITLAEEVKIPEKNYTEFTYFIGMPGDELNSSNDIQDIIAEKYGVKVNECWLAGQTSTEAVGCIIASGDYPDYINSDDMNLLLEYDALIPLDDYLEKYPEFRDTWFTAEEWDKFRQADGHIYWINTMGNTFGKSKTTTHNDEAFWIQVRVLEWAGYPEIKTLDQYFDVIERYLEANPAMPDGTPNIGYTILCDDWRYFCLENAGQFLAGYPNDGSVIVNKSTMTIEDYNTSAETKAYLKKLNEEYHKGIIDPDSFTQTYDEYIAKLSTGAFLGMVDQWWDFAYSVEPIFEVEGLSDIGCNYVCLGLTSEEGMDNRWHTYEDTVNNSSGIGITVDCKDPDKAFDFIVKCAMDQELHDLRFWGVEGVDYLVDDDGLYYRNDEMRYNTYNSRYLASHFCRYSYMPQWNGTSMDGKNAMKPDEQPSEVMAGMSEPLRKCFEAYGAENYPDMIGSVVETNGPWFPMYAYSNLLTTETAAGRAFALMGEIKHEWLPKVVMNPDFEAGWNEYMDAYNECNPQDFISEMQDILDTFK